jgi:hypothetical protein
MCRAALVEDLKLSRSSAVYFFKDHGCETWSFSLREERRLRMIEKRVLRGVFGGKKEEVTGRLRKLHNEVLHNLYSSPDQEAAWEI